MKEQDKRAVEGMARCGIDLEGLISAFSQFPKEEIESVYYEIHKDELKSDTIIISRNCS